MNCFLKVLLLSCSVLSACRENTKSIHKHSNQRTKNLSGITAKEPNLCVIDKTKIPNSNSTTIRYSKITLVVNKLNQIDDKYLVGKRLIDDTTEIYYDLTESPLGQKLYITSCKLTDLKIEFSYETSLSINFYGEHFDLLDWKHHHSKWVELNCINGIYQIPSVSRKQATQFPKYSKEELEEKSIKDSFPGVYLQEEGVPIVGISRIFIKASGKLNGKRISYLAVFYEPRGAKDKPQTQFYKSQVFAFVYRLIEKQ